MTKRNSIKFATVWIMLLIIPCTWAQQTPDATETPRVTDGAARPLLHGLFSDNAILQRDRRDPIWGWTEPGNTVVVKFDHQQQNTRAGADGRWEVFIPPHLGANDSKTGAGLLKQRDDAMCDQPELQFDNPQMQSRVGVLYTDAMKNLMDGNADHPSPKQCLMTKFYREIWFHPTCSANIRFRSN